MIKKYYNIGPAIIFIFLIAIMTFPLIFNVRIHMPGFFSTDESFAPLWDSWRIKYSWQNHLPLAHTQLIAYPFGVDIYSSGYCSYVWLVITYFLSLLTTPILTYNFQVITNLFLSGFMTYLLVSYLTKSKLSAISSGIIFAFCPYQFARIWQHIGLTYNQWIPLVIFAAILLKEKPFKKQLIIFLISILLLFSFDWVIMYLATVAVCLFFVYIFIYNWRMKFFKNFTLLKNDLAYFKKIAIAGIIAIVLLSPQFLPVIKNSLRLSSTTTASVFNAYRRPFEDLFAQSARPLSYLLPAIVHPLFGKFTENFIGSSLYGESVTEHTLYLGWIPLILAFLAFRHWRSLRRQRFTAGNRGLTKTEDFHIGFFLFLAISSWLFSQPPWWSLGPIKILMPPFFMYKILPMFRAYCRFGIVVMLAVAVLAGFGLKVVLERLKAQKAKIGITILFCALILFEFWNYPPFKVIDVSKVPAVYYWLKEQPKDIVIAEYPLDADSPNETYKLYQITHLKKMINSTVYNTYANKVAKAIVKLSASETASVLAWMKVKYVLVHQEGYLQTELVKDREELNKIPDNKGIKLVKSFPAQDCPREDTICVQKTGPIDVYEVITRPKEPKI